MSSGNGEYQPRQEHPEYERALLGSMLDRGGVMVDMLRERLSVNHLSRKAHRQIYEAILIVADAGQDIDVLTVGRQLERQGDLEDAGGQVGLMALVSDDATLTTGAHLVDVVKEDYVRRVLQHRATDLIQATRNEALTADDLATMADEVGLDLDAVERHDVQSVGQLARQARTRVRAAAQDPKRARGIRIGIPKLSRMLNGWQKGDLILVCGRPSCGKTAAGLQFALDADVPTLIESKEMKSEALGDRFLASASGVNSHVLRSGRAWSPTREGFREIDPFEWQEIDKAVDEYLATRPIYVDDECYSVEDVQNMTRRMVREKGVQLVIVDYLQLINAPSNRRYGTREQEVATIGAGLKEIAKRSNVSMIALTQLSRAIEQRTNKRPQLSDLRESGALEQHSDVVIGLHRPGAYDVGADQSLAEMLVLKQRNGPTGMINACFEKETGRWGERKKEDE